MIEPGTPLDRVDTPALVVDLDALERNLDRMAAFAKRTGTQVRPHAKTHKSPVVGRMQLDRGAIGLCCAKLGEAEVMADAGLGPLAGPLREAESRRAEPAFPGGVGHDPSVVGFSGRRARR